jgi:hypothetical protein
MITLIRNWVNKVKDYFYPKKQSTLIDEVTKQKLQILAGVKEHDRDKGAQDLAKTFGKIKPVTQEEMNKTPLREDTREQKEKRIINHRFDSLPMSSLSTEAKLKIIDIVSADLLLQAVERTKNYHRAGGDDKPHTVKDYRPDEPVMWVDEIQRVANEMVKNNNTQNDEQTKENEEPQTNG